MEQIMTEGRYLVVLHKGDYCVHMKGLDSITDAIEECRLIMDNRKYRNDPSYVAFVQDNLEGGRIHFAVSAVLGDIDDGNQAEKYVASIAEEDE